MSQIKSTKTGPENRLKALFKKHRITGYRRNVSLFGKPDFMFRRERLLVFIDGCFWHKCHRCYIRPKSNTKFWDTKIENNIIRDRKVNIELRKNGWKVLRIWEHELKKNTDKVVLKIRRLLLTGE